MKRLFASALTLALALTATASAIEKSQTVVIIGGEKFYIHTVLPGETLYSLSRAYDVGERVIVQYNPSAAEGLRTDERLKIPFVEPAAERMPERKLRKTFDTHTVLAGETLYAISRRYGIPIPTLIEDNPTLDPIRLRPDMRLLIRRTEVGTESAEQVQARWEQYRDDLNSVSEGGTSYYLVHAGDTFYSLARRFGLTEAELSALNGGMHPEALKAGAIIRVPGNGGGNARQTAPQAPAAPQPAPATAFGDLGAGSGNRDFPHYEAPDTEGARIAFRKLSDGDTLRVAMLLPLTTDGTANANYLEFYQGFLLGLDSVKRTGRSVALDLYDTGRDTTKLRRIMEDESFLRAHLIVGPVHENLLGPVARYGEARAVPVVSPLAHLTHTNSGAVFQLAPDPARKYDKAADLFTGDARKVTLIYSDRTDGEFEQEVLNALGDTEHMRHHYRYVHSSGARAGGPGDLTPLLHNDRDNLFVVMADNEVDVDRILAALASAYTGIVSRGLSEPRFTVLGNARWNRYHNLDRTMFFKDRVVFLSTYHAKRDSEVIRTFDSDYIRAFGSLPSLFSYRGYDAAVLFCPAMFGGIEEDLEGEEFTPLQTTYLFDSGEENATHTNRNWMRVEYGQDFTIGVE